LRMEQHSLFNDSESTARSAKGKAVCLKE
jgi:hypothetical protein